MSLVSALNFSGAKTVPVILQAEAGECGLACLAMIAGYYSRETSLIELRHRLSVGLTGLTLRGLMHCADQLGLNSRPVRAELEDLKNISKPCILHWQFNHFVVLKKISGRSVEIVDPARGEVRLTLNEVSEKYTGVALELSPNERFQPKNKTETMKFSDLWGSVIGLKRSLGQMLLLAFAIEMFALLIPYFTQIVVDQILISHDVDFLLILSVGFLFLVCFKALTGALRAWMVLYLGSTLNVQLSARMVRHLLSLPLAFFEKRHIGDITSRFQSLDHIRRLLTTEFVVGLVDGFMVVTTLVIMLLYNLCLGLIAVSAVIIYALFRLSAYQALKSRTDLRITMRAKEDSLFLESLRGIQPLKNFGKESRRQSVWQNAYVNAINADIKVEKLNIAHIFMYELLSGTELICIVWVASYAIMSKTFTVGMLMAFLAFRQRFATQAHALIDKVLEFRLASVHLQRLSDIALSKPEDDLEGMGLFANDPRGHLALVNVSFRYSDHAGYVIKDLHMHIEAGECVAITGPSGIGKSTLIKIMLGLIKPETGKVLLDDVDIRTIGLKNYRHYMASVMQDDTLFSGTIRDNITMFDPAPDEDLVKSCAHTACILQDIQNMPMVFLTLIGDMGSALSGGQKQRVLLARALYKQPKLLFLDEATSHLDIVTEMQVNQAIKNLGITRIMVAHREATLRLADRVIHIAEVQQQEPNHGTPEGRAMHTAGRIPHELSHHHVGAEGRLTQGLPWCPS